MHRYIDSGSRLAKSPSPISQAVVAGTHCYVSGQLAVDADGIFHPGSLREEALRAFANVFAALEASGFHHNEIVYVDLAFADLGEFSRS